MRTKIERTFTRSLLLLAATGFSASAILADEKSSAPDERSAAPQEKPSAAPNEKSAQAAPDKPAARTDAKAQEGPQPKKAERPDAEARQVLDAQRAQPGLKQELRIALQESASARKEAMSAYHEAQKAFHELKDRVETGSLSEEEKQKAQAAKASLMKAREQLRSAEKKSLVARAKTLSPEQRKEILNRLKKQEESREATRAARAETKRKELKEKLGQDLQLPRVQQELRRHAWRVARLNRLIDLAEAAERQDALERAQALLEKENTLHQKRLEQAKLASNAPHSSQDASAQKKPAATK